MNLHRRIITGTVATVAFAATASPAVAKTHHRRSVRCTVPKLTGDSLTTARRQLRLHHCNVGTVHRPTIASGKQTVYRQSPKPGRRIAHGGKVAIWLKTTTMTQTTPTTPAPPAPSLTTTYLSVLTTDGLISADNITYNEITATLTYSSAREPVLYLVGQPITYTMVDLVTNQTLATFSGTSDTPTTGCAVAYQLNTTGTVETETITGESITPYQGATPLPACEVGTVTFPFNDPVAITASFAGNTEYAASTSQPAIS